MLEAGHRAAYADLLAPPSGRRLERAVGLTYSLDLTTLAASLEAFAGTDEPARLLELADKVTVYCQAGRLRPGGTPDPLHVLLDKSVRTVAPPEGGFFHPKLWLLKFAGPDASVPPGYRLVVGSLNASETLIYFEIGAALEGELLTDAAEQNGELISFLRASCPGLERLDELCGELARVRFAPPPGFSGWRFESQRGLPYAEKLFARLKERRFEKLAIVSPALAGEALELLLTEAAPETAPILVSTKASLDALPPDLLRRFEAYAVRDRAADGAPAGLHAKILVGERSGRTEVWVGSANAAKGGWLGPNTEAMAAFESDGYTLSRFKEDFIRGPWIAPYRREPDHADGRELKERNRQIERYIGFLTRAAWSLDLHDGRAELRFETAEKDPLPALDRISLRSSAVGLLGQAALMPLNELIKAGRLSLGIEKAPTEFLAVELALENPARAVKFLVQARSSFDKRAREKAYFLR